MSSQPGSIQTHEPARTSFEVETLIAREARAAGYDHVSGERLDAAPARDDDRTSGSRVALAKPVDRRSFLAGGAALFGGAVIASTLQMSMIRSAEAKSRGRPRGKVPCPYGDPVPTLDESTGLPLLGLPPGFRYISYGWTGDPLLGGTATPPLHDGMGVLREIGPLAILCRNHEAGGGASYRAGGLQYSPNAAGGNTNLLFDRRREKWVAAWATLSGTWRNCAGGVTPQNTWLSCEESLDTSYEVAGDTTSKAYTHGWIFEVPAVGESDAKPIVGMGRRSHEAASVDPRTGIVYMFEDADRGGVYRFIPKKRFDYHAGGRLEMLAVAGRPKANLRGANPLGGNGAPYPVAIGAPLDVEWVPVADPESVAPSNFDQGHALGGAEFRRPEGSWYADGSVYFVSTDGGQSGNGMVFELDLRRMQLKLLYDSPSADELDNPDNLVVTPRGGLLFCEDNSGSPSYLLNGVSTERLVGYTPEGEIFTFAQNLIDFGGSTYTRPNNARVFTGNYRANEWAGATFDRRGEWLFVNNQTPGVTFAITGPWKHGPL